MVDSRTSYVFEVDVDYDELQFFCIRFAYRDERDCSVIGDAECFNSSVLDSSGFSWVTFLIMFMNSFNSSVLDSDPEVL